MPPWRRPSVSRRPLNAETDPRAFQRRLTPQEALFVRNHGDVPPVDPLSWRLRLMGRIRRPLELSLADLKAMPRVRLEAVMECAGNGRSRFQPAVAGTAWGDGAVGCVRATGTPLRRVLREAQPSRDATTFVFTGADLDGSARPFQRSLPRPQALGGDAVLAYEINGRAILPEHGGPVRLLVPGWYGVASVKWLGSIEAIAGPFQGFYQTDHYVIRNGAKRPRPVERILVNSRIIAPGADSVVRVGQTVRVWGRAWSGNGPVRRVDVSLDGGGQWRSARLEGPATRYGWRRWSVLWRPETPGAAVLLSRATDSAGNEQPGEPNWNELGYENNACAPRRVIVRPSSAARGAPRNA